MLNIVKIIETIRDSYKVTYTVKNFERRFYRLTGLNLSEMRDEAEVISEFKKAYDEIKPIYDRLIEEETQIIKEIERLEE